MAAKQIELHEKARAGIVAGASLVAEAARVTLGPKGRNVLLQKSFGAPVVTKDGVTVVKEIEFEDKFEDMGAKLIREVAQKTADVAGAIREIVGDPVPAWAAPIVAELSAMGKK